MRDRTKLSAAITTVFAVIAAGGGVIGMADPANAADAAKPGTTDSGLQLSSVDRARTDAQMQANAAQVQQATTKLAGGVPFAVSMPIPGHC